MSLDQATLAQAAERLEEAERTRVACRQFSLGPTNGGAAYGISVQLAITLPGLDAEQKQKLVDTAHQVCPYSNATRGNIDVEITIA